MGGGKPRLVCFLALIKFHCCLMWRKLLDSLTTYLWSQSSALRVRSKWDQRTWEMRSADIQFHAFCVAYFRVSPATSGHEDGRYWSQRWRLLFRQQSWKPSFSDLPGLSHGVQCLSPCFQSFHHFCVFQAVETSRLEHRYLDLRRDEMQFNLRLRSHAAMAMRKILTQHFGKFWTWKFVMGQWRCGDMTWHVLQGLLKWRLQLFSSKPQRLGGSHGV